MKILDKLKAIFFDNSPEEIPDKEITPKPDAKHSCYWCDEDFELGEFQKHFNKKWFHRRCYKNMIRQAKKDMGFSTS